MIIYPFTLLFLFFFVKLQQYFMADIKAGAANAKGKWHPYALLLGATFFAAIISQHYFPSTWQDWLLAGVIYMALYPLAINKIALKTDLFHVGTTAGWDKRLGKWQYFMYIFLIVGVSLIKIFIKPKNKKL